MKTPLLTFVLVTLVMAYVMGQVAPAEQANFNKAPQILPPAPNAASLGKYGGINIGLSSGTPNINIPIYDYSSANLHLPISLSYTTSGLKVDEIASRVGLGWALNAGGVITRTVHCSVDEVSKRLTPANTNDRNFYNYLRQVGASTGPYATFDTQPDVYTFNFNGNTGSFIMNDSSLADGTRASQPILLTYSNIKFDRNIIPGGGYDFRAITADGVQYLFKIGDFSTTFNDAYASTPNCFYVYNTAVPTAWYLNQIIDPNNDTITLTYSSIQYDYLVSASQTIYRLDNIHYTYPSQCGLGYQVAAPQLDNTLCVNRLQTSGVLLNSISSSAGGKVVFNYIARGDYNDKLLSSISIYQPDSLQAFKVFDLTYVYPVVGSFYSGAASDLSLYSRPFLMSLTERSLDASISKKHSFLYNGFEGLPPRLSFAQDHWGYFNGKNNTTFIPVPIGEDFKYYLPLATANRAPDPAYCQKGCLSSITYPPGGKDSLLYEGNMAPQLVTTYSPPTTLSVTGGTYSNSVIYVSGNALLQTSQTVHLHVYRSPTDQYDSTMSYTNAKLYDAAGRFIWGYNLNQRYVYDVYQDFFLQPGTYHLEMEIFGNNPVAGCEMTYVPGLPTTQLQNVNVGGVRISKVLTYDNESPSPTVKKYYYADPVRPQANVYEKNLKITQRCTDLFVNQSCIDLVSFYYFTMYSNSIYNGYGNTGSSAIYGTVTESYGENFENGGVEHHFTTVPSKKSNGNVTFGAIAIDQSYLNGRETYQNTFKTRGTTRVPIKEIYTVFKYDQGVPLSQLAYTIHQNYDYGCVITGPVQQVEWDGYDVSVNEFNTNWLYPDSIRTLTYDTSGINFVEQDQKFEYADKQSTLSTKITTSLSDGRSLVEKMYYPTNLTLTGTAEAARQALVNRHIVSPVLQRQTYKGGLATYVTETDYNVFSNGLVLPATYSTSTLTNPLDKRVEFYKYTNLGKILEQGKERDKKDAYIWDYKRSFPIAQVSNADSASIAYTSFESDGSGNWTIGLPSRNMTAAITGTNSYNLNSNISKSGLNASTTYIVSYWTQNTVPYSIAGTIANYPVRGKTINGWTYYAHRVTGQTTITISGIGRIDELRLYPVGAQMTTYTYTPLVGMTSQCDVNNRITYYEYDGLARLKRIRDQDQNILKSLAYQYQAASGCGPNCFIEPMQTFSGSNTLSYPVGVFNANGRLLGKADSQAAYISLWNADTANANRGTLAAGADSMHFKVTLNAGKTLPFITGCRYYQVDLAWNKLDGVLYWNGVHVDFGDGTGMRLGKSMFDSSAALAPNTIYYPLIDRWNNALYIIHTYPDTSLKTLTFYHNDASESEYLDNGQFPAPGLTKLSNLRGNLPQNTQLLGGSCYQQPTMTSVAAIRNWNTIRSVQKFGLNNGDRTNPVKNVGYAQDFMQYNKGLTAISIGGYFYYSGVQDTTFKISRLKSDWNTYFTSLQFVEIVDDQWNREDLSALKQLNHLQLFAARQNHLDNLASPLVPIPSTVLDGIINQIAAGAGQAVNNGKIAIVSGGTDRTSNSQTAYNLLVSKGWTITIDKTTL